MNIRIVREAGGLGDILRIIPVLRGLREKHPGARLWLLAPDEYRPVLRGWYDEFRPTPWANRRPRDAPLDEKRWPYLKLSDSAVKADRSIDLYCPAFRHEADQRGEVWFDRIDLFCRAAQVSPSSKVPVVNLIAADVEAADRWLRDCGWRKADDGVNAPGATTPPLSNPHSATRNPQSVIGLQPFSTDPARNWPPANWLRLADALEAEGHRVIVFDCCPGRTRAFRQRRVVDKPLGFVAALLARCDLLVAPDSGLGHLAAAVGTPAVGLFASQSGAVMYRHYPRHRFVYPAWDSQTHCRWPCYWARPKGCGRDALLAAGATCPMLARITVEEALEAVRRQLNAPDPTETSPVALPAMSHTGRRAVMPYERIEALPVPRRDFALTRLAIPGAVADAAPHLREAFRVLKPGGHLYLAAPAPPGLDALLARHGFATARHQPMPQALVCRKVGTWA